MIIREQIEAKAKEILKKHTDNFSTASYNIIDAMTEIALWMEEQQGSGMRWVRASEKMPAQGTSVVIWIKSKNHVGWGVANYDTPSRIYYETSTEGLFSDDCLWLDESTPSEIDRLREENEKLKRAWKLETGSEWIDVN